MKTSIIIDMDGTLADVRHRQHYAQAAQWDAFHELCGEDKPNEDVLELIKEMDRHYDIIICTARPEKYRNVTLAWLTAWGIPSDIILMRGDNDWRKSEVLKIEMLEEHFGSKQAVLESVLFVLDDRDKIISSLRDYGLPCWQVRPGGY